MLYATEKAANSALEIFERCLTPPTASSSKQHTVWSCCNANKQKKGTACALLLVMFLKGAPGGSTIGFYCFSVPSAKAITSRRGVQRIENGLYKVMEILYRASRSLNFKERLGHSLYKAI